MKVLKFNDVENESQFRRTYTMDESVQIDSIGDVIRGFENEETKMFKCRCQSFDEDGHPLYREYTVIEDIEETKNLPNPYVRFNIEFQDRLTGVYKFDIGAYTDSNLVAYVVDKKKLAIDSSKGRARK
jgi:hypothetical protein